jgi:plastocyanin
MGTGSFAKSTAVSVVIENMKFTPDHLVIHPGDKVTWENKDLVPHTVTAADKSFDSKLIAPGKSWKFKFHKKGNYQYHCDFHPTMKASITVQ